MILVPALRVADRRFLSRAVLTGEPFSAAEAAAAGLLTGVVDDEQALDAWVDAAVASILKGAPGRGGRHQGPAGRALRGAVVRGARGGPDPLGRAVRGAEAAEGMDAFLHKRTPSWEVTAP